MKQLNNAVGPQIRANAGKGRWLYALGAAVSLLAALQVATQYFAEHFGYQAALGPHVNHVYRPWAIVGWWMKWEAYYHKELMTATSAGLLILWIGAMGMFIARIVQSNTGRANLYKHGSARWAERADIENAGLLPRPRSLWDLFSGRGRRRQTGVYVGGWIDRKGRNHYLRHDGAEHVLAVAPTRSGKGVGLVVPTLLSWLHSSLITDLKGELWALTAGWRQQHAGNKVIRFEPASITSARWNPLDEIRIATEHEVGDVQNLAQLIVDPRGKGLESHWDKTAFSLLVGVIIHALYKARNEGTVATLATVDGLLSDPERDSHELWVEMTTYEHVDGKNHPVAGRAGRDMLNKPEEERGSVHSTTLSFLSLYRDPIVAANISESDFRIRDLMHHTHPVSVFVVTQPNDKDRLKPLVRILVNMTVRLLTDKLKFTEGRPDPDYKHRLLLMLDEFPALGRLEIMQESLAFVAGYGIKCYLICQDTEQLIDAYGRHESITANCHIQVAYQPLKTQTADWLSKMVGQTTVVDEQITTSGNRIGAMLGHVSRTFQEAGRPLMTPGECMRMPGPKKRDEEIEEPGDMLILAAGTQPIYGRQPLYFQDESFSARARIQAPEESDRIRPRRSDGEQVRI